MSTPSPSPANTAATRSGSRVVVTRTDDVRDGAEPIIAVMTDDGEVMSFTPSAAADLSAMLARAATGDITVTIKVTNSYPDASFERILDVVVPAHRDHDYATDWMYDCLWEHTGEGPEYANTPAVYEVEIISVPAYFEYLVGLKVDSYG